MVGLSRLGSGDSEHSRSLSQEVPKYELEQKGGVPAGWSCPSAAVSPFTKVTSDSLLSSQLLIADHGTFLCLMEFPSL